MTLRRGVLITVLVFDVLLLAGLWLVFRPPMKRVSDTVGMIPESDERNYNNYLSWVEQESGVDVRILLVPATGDTPLETYALEQMRERGVGRKTGARGLLIVYDTSRRAMRVEVGPRLQGVIPDAFAGYLMREHVRAFFGDRRPELGLRTTLFMVHWRIRMARLGREYDPAFQEYITDVRRLASGGGASGSVGAGATAARFINRSGDTAAQAYFTPQPTVEQVRQRYHEWLALGGGQIDVPLFTPGSQEYLGQLPMSRAFNEFLLATEYGRAYRIDERGDLALLYFTDDPFLSPKFLRRGPEGWRLDLRAEVANTQEAAGLPYTWRLRDSGDDFSRVFADRYTPVYMPLVGEFYRIAGGDNRTLGIKGGAAAVESELAPRPRSAGFIGPTAPAVEQLTVFQMAERIRRMNGRPRIVLLYGIRVAETVNRFADVVGVASGCRAQGVEILAFHTDNAPSAVARLRDFLTRHEAPFSPLQIYQWRPGLLSSTARELGIEIGQQWSSPLVAAIDRSDQVTWQSQGVTDWSLVQAACEAIAR